MPTTTIELGPHQVRLCESSTNGRTNGGPTASGGQPPLLLLNGIGANLEMLQPLRSRLTRRTIAFDLPGTGCSPTPWLPMSIADDARLALRLLDRLGVGTVDVLGFSFGGSVAQELARLAPDRVRRLVLASTSCGWGGVPGNPLALALLKNPLRYYSPSVFKAAAPMIVGGAGARDEPFLDAQAQDRVDRPPSPLGYWYQLCAAATWTSWPWLHTLRQPTLVLSGDRDHVVPVVNSRIMTRLLPDARLRTWSGGGHMVLLDSAAAVAPEIDGFLAA